jgi:ferredoxin-NADP reductase
MTTPMPFIDSFLNQITMYKLVFYGLLLLAAASVILGFLNLIPYGGLALAASFLVLLIGTWGADALFARVLHAARNLESSWITALILFFIMSPITGMSDVWITLAAGVLAALSKYLFAIRKRHIFNPAAAALVALGLIGTGGAIWWVATPILLLPVLALGLLITRKIRRFDLLSAFIVTETLVAVAYGVFSFQVPILDTLSQNFLSFPVIFFGTIMLTEPFTTPPTRTLRIIYGALAGLLFVIPFHLALPWGGIYSTPALALVLANLFAYAVSSKQRLMLTLIGKDQLSASVYEFVFRPNVAPRFFAGQYMEWTLPHKKTDIRGNRRYFTIASAPEEKEVRLGIRIGERSSSFKKALEAMPEGSTMAAASIAGGFTLPRDQTAKILAIAGGIGITPFISMLRSMVATGKKRDMVIIYAANAEADFAYADVIDSAAALGVRAFFLPGKPITKELLEAQVPDHHEREWYISGPQGMVARYKTLARSCGIDRIKTDYFPGL